MREGKGKGRRKIIFWNVVGLMRQDMDFWNYIKRYDFIGMCERKRMVDQA